MFRKVLLYYWRHGKKYPFSGGAVFVLYVGAILLAAIVTPIQYKNIIDVASGSAPQSSAALSAMMTSVFIIGGLIIAANVLFRIADYVMAYYQSRVLRDLANFAFTEIHKHSYGFFADNFAGALVTKAKRFVRAFETIHDRLIYNFVLQGTKIIGALVVIFYILPWVGLAYLVWLVLYFILIAWFVKIKMKYDLAEANADSEVTARYADTITNALAIKMFATKKPEYDSFAKVTNVEEKKRRKAWNVGNFQMVIQGALFGILEFLVIYMAVQFWQEGAITVGTIVLFQVYVIATFDAVWQFGRSLTDVAKALADAKEMVDIFELPEGVSDRDNARPMRVENGKIEFRNVTFGYENSNPVFENFSFVIQPGEKIGLVGHSGAGKTTITKLLLRFADVQKGEILIDEQNIALARQNDLRRHISYVPQEPLLFHRTLRENIAYGNPTATMDEIVRAAKKARAHDFISNLTDGYKTLVGERGVKLSGGERQRVAIARAMLKDAPILILDEATSSLDSESERKIQEALKDLMQGKTAIVVAHRLSTIQQMDSIVVVEDGRIVERGSHDELLKEDGVYASYWKQQAGGFLSD